PRSPLFPTRRSSDLKAADRFATERTNELAGDGQNLTDSIAQVQRSYQMAMQAAMDASDAEFRSKGSEVDPKIAQEAIAKRQEIQDRKSTRLNSSHVK